MDNNEIKNCILEVLKQCGHKVMAIQCNPLTKAWHINLADRHEQIRFKPAPGSTMEECRQQFRKLMGLEEPILEEEIDNLRLRTPDNIFGAMQRLKKIGAGAVDPLIQSLLNENESHTFRCRVASTLAMIGDPRAIAPLIKTLNDKDAEIRWSAIKALAGIGDRSAIEPLKKLIAIETGFFSITPKVQVNVKRDAEDALSQIMARAGG